VLKQLDATKPSGTVDGRNDRKALTQ
jgi:hypothetical protein